MQPSKDLIRDFFLQQAELFTDEFYIDEKPEHAQNKDVINWDELMLQVMSCTKCELSKTRTKVVFGGGKRDADLLFIGEAPGEKEDLQGEPFVGRAGQLLDKILAAIQLTRNQVFIANILKCRPPQNRTPHAGEIEQCEPYLLNQIDLIQPKLIVCLGLTAAKTLLRIESPLREMRDKIYTYHGVNVIVTYHPSALLRNPNLKKFAWEDFQKIQKLYKENRESV
jgi:DNA polymerase